MVAKTGYQISRTGAASGLYQVQVIKKGSKADSQVYELLLA